MRQKGKVLGKVLILLGLMILGNSVFAQEISPQEQGVQTNYTEQQIELFANTIMEVFPIQQEAQNAMIEEIKANDLTVDEFNQIASKLQSGNTEDIKEENMDNFQMASAEIRTIQQEAQESVSETIEEQGMTSQKFSSMIDAYQKNPQLREKVDKKISSMNE